MAINAAKLAIAVSATGADQAAADILKVSKAGENVDKKVGVATRNMSRFGAAAAQAGQLGTAGLSGIAQQAADIAFGFGPAGAVVGALATTTIAIATLFFKAQQEAEKFQRSLRKLLYDSNFDAANAQLHDLDFQISEARRRLAKAEAMPGSTIEGILLRKQEELKAEHELNGLLEKRAPLVAVVQKLAVERGEQQATALKYQQEQTAAAEKEAAAQRAAAQAIRDKANAARDATANRKAKEEADAALAESSKGITLGGPSLAGFGAAENAPGIGVQNPQYRDIAGAQAIADAQDIADRYGAQGGEIIGDAIVNGFASAFQGGGVGGALANFGASILSGLGRIIGKMGITIGIFGKIMLKLQAWITANPLFAGAAAVIAGAALVALGSSLGATARGGGSGGGFSGGGIGEISAPAQVTNITIASISASKTAAGVTPMQSNQFTVIGPNDPTAQRGILELIDNGRRRGL